MVDITHLADESENFTRQPRQQWAALLLRIRTAAGMVALWRDGLSFAPAGLMSSP